MKDKHMARNYGSPSVKVESCQKVSYPSLFWWTLETALLYFNWGASQNCPQLGWWVVTVPKGIGTLCFWNTLIWLQLLSLFFTPAPGAVVFIIISISYLPKHLNCVTYHTTLHRAIGSIFLPASKAILAKGRLAVNRYISPYLFLVYSKLPPILVKFISLAKAANKTIVLRIQLVKKFPN